MGKKLERIKNGGRRREKSQLLSEAENLVRKANKIENPLAEFSAFHVFDKNGIRAKLEFQNVCDISEEVFDEIFKLEKENMENVYNSCSWGWNEKKKFKEMKEASAKYLIAKAENREILGFSHFRFDMDYGDEVLYCYELQLSSRVRRKGLGKFLIQVLELIAFKNNMKKVVLTVLKHNTPAITFFQSLSCWHPQWGEMISLSSQYDTGQSKVTTNILISYIHLIWIPTGGKVDETFGISGYQIDETNPEENIFSDIPYQILSKLNKKRLPLSNSSNET